MAVAVPFFATTLAGPHEGWMLTPFLFGLLDFPRRARAFRRATPGRKAKHRPPLLTRSAARATSIATLPPPITTISLPTSALPVFVHLAQKNRCRRARPWRRSPRGGCAARAGAPVAQEDRAVTFGLEVVQREVAPQRLARMHLDPLPHDQIDLVIQVFLGQAVFGGCRCAGHAAPAWRWRRKA